MYARHYKPGSVILDYGEQPSELFFIKYGQVEMYAKGGVLEFGKLPTFSWFGDWCLLHKLRSLVIYKSCPDVGQKSSLMLCINKRKFNELLDLYPSIKKHFEELSLERRYEIHKQMNEATA